MTKIERCTGPASIAAARELFREYQAELGVDLGFQDFESEVDGLPGDYAPPGGRLLLAEYDDLIAGCIALRPLGGGDCEMKRLFVRPQFRKTGLGKLLVDQIITEARAVGYQRMYLDTLPSMQSAQRLYESIGFRDVPAYRHNPIEGTRFLCLDL
jgi:ribosomal protein S18 acetylase RimI-like enzyme